MAESFVDDGSLESLHKLFKEAANKYWGDNLQAAVSLSDIPIPTIGNVMRGILPIKAEKTEGGDEQEEFTKKMKALYGE